MSGFGNSKAAAVSIRPARTDEQKMLESLQRRASLSNPGDRDALLANPDAIAVPLEQLAEGCVFVAERAGAVVGFAAVIKRPDGAAELDALFVEPHFWKHGIGRLLVDHVAKLAGGWAASFLHVIGNPHAEGFYVSCGFRVTGTVETQFGIGLAMRKVL
jgi:GNAT superfamily N-acetyltransferase